MGEVEAKKGLLLRRDEFKRVGTWNRIVEDVYRGQVSPSEIHTIVLEIGRVFGQGGRLK